MPHDESPQTDDRGAVEARVSQLRDLGVARASVWWESAAPLAWWYAVSFAGARREVTDELQTALSELVEAATNVAVEVLDLDEDADIDTGRVELDLAAGSLRASIDRWQPALRRRSFRFDLEGGVSSGSGGEEGEQPDDGPDGESESWDVEWDALSRHSNEAELARGRADLERLRQEDPDRASFMSCTLDFLAASLGVADAMGAEDEDREQTEKDDDSDDTLDRTEVEGVVAEALSLLRRAGVRRASATAKGRHLLMEMFTGRSETETIDPTVDLQRAEARGAWEIHVVDVDGAEPGPESGIADPIEWLVDAVLRWEIGDWEASRFSSAAVEIDVDRGVVSGEHVKEGRERGEPLQVELDVSGSP